MHRFDDVAARERGSEGRSELACPVCGEHRLAVDEPPHIDIMGVQPYSDLLGMGDLSSRGAMGIECRSCGTYWRDRAAFDRGEAQPPEGDEPPGGEEPPEDEGAPG
jgi:hypothetical protein